MCMFLYTLTRVYYPYLTSLHHVCIVQIQNPLDMEGNRGVTNVVVDLYYNDMDAATVRAIAIEYNRLHILYYMSSRHNLFYFMFV